ncbi:MAG: DUF2878 domain-containing protein [Plesiomonas sp.]|uniref:DUF2878 domain-containing protein n=1 Tax=Plesiomonas sp. TaxID=2486279 RepID=UPI003F3D575F
MRRLRAKYWRWGHFFAFELYWLAAVQFHATVLCLLLVLLHLVLTPTPLRDLKILPLSALGIGIDFLLTDSGVFIFPSTFPVWMMALWVGFILALPHGLNWLFTFHLRWQIFFGALGGALSYFSAYALGVVRFGYPLIPVIIGIAAIWALLLPLLIYFVRRISTRYPDDVSE